LRLNVREQNRSNVVRSVILKSNKPGSLGTMDPFWYAQRVIYG
jgi:hypothetical protein